MILLLDQKDLMLYNENLVELIFPEKGYEKKKHVNFNLYQNTNMLILIETIFCKRNQERFLFLFQMDELSAVWEVPWV